MRKVTVLSLLLFLCTSSYGDSNNRGIFREEITKQSTLRTVRNDGHNGKIVFEQNLDGNGEFGVLTRYLSYTHSILNIDPPMLPDAPIEKARLKLYLKYCGHDEITVTIDSMHLEKHDFHHFHFGWPKKYLIRVENSPLQDGVLDITLANPEGEFVLYRSVLELHYQYDIRTDVDNSPFALPVDFDLKTNYPNPFNSSTIIEYILTSRSNVRIDIFNALGQRVRSLVDEMEPVGSYRVEWDGKNGSGFNAPSGVYFYRITTDSFAETKKMILLK